jgi:septal ring factor EnvC (AmiA/AmiB activator)
VIAAGAALLLASGLVGAVATDAGATPPPSIAQVQATINTLTGQFNKANQQYDQAEEQLTAAKSRLKQVNKQLAREQAQYQAARKLVVQIADAAFEDSGSTSLAGLLTAGDPARLLAQASLVLQVAGTRNTQTKAFLADANQLASVQQEQQRTEQGIAQIAGQMGKTKDHIATLLSKQKSILSSLTGTELARVQQGRRHHERRLRRPDRFPGGHRGGLRVQAARLRVRLRRHRPLRRRLRLLRPGA